MAIPAGATSPLTALITVDDIKSFLNFPANDDGSSDTKLGEFIDAATEVIESITGPLGTNVVTRFFDGGLPFIVLPDRYVAAITLITENIGVSQYTLTEQPLGSTVDEYGYTWDRSINKIVRRGASGAAQPFAPGTDGVVVDYVTGLDSIPANVVMACRELVRHWWQWGQMGLRPALSNPNFGGGDDEGPPTSSNAYAIPNRVLELLMPSKRGPGIA